MNEIRHCLSLLIVLSLALGCSSSSDPGDGGGGGGNGGVGSIRVTTTTTGPDADSDGYTLTMAGAADRQIVPNGSTVYTDVAIGTRQITLGGISANCSVGPANPADAVVTEGATVDVEFDVSCSALPTGTLELTTSVTNNFDPDGFEVLIDGVSSGAVDIDVTTSFPDLLAGTIELELVDIVSNCSVVGDNPRSIAIPPAGVASVTMEVLCESPADGRIVFRGNMGGQPGPQILVMNTDGTGQFRLLECPGGCFRPKWSPDGKEIAFGMDVGGVLHLSIVGQDGREVRHLTPISGFMHYDWSPDGEWLVHAVEVGGGSFPPHQLYRIRSDGTELTALAPPPAGMTDESPSWSPDGNRIAFVRRNSFVDGPTPSDYYDTNMIVSSDLDGLALDTIVPSPPVSHDDGWEYRHGGLAWAPDGTRLAFDRQEHPSVSSSFPRVHTVAADGSDLQAPGSLFDHWTSGPSWSPDGSRLIVDGGNFELFVITPDGSSKESVGSGDSREAPDWGP